MKITIITVTYNSERSIETAIGSVLGQSVLKDVSERMQGKGMLGNGLRESGRPLLDVSEHPQLEYLIIDGASKDATIAKAEAFRPAFEQAGVEYRIISEPDRGIYDAMNKGIHLATGDIIGILNSDDWYEPDTLETVLQTFRETACDLMFAHIRMHKADGSTFVKKARQRKFQTSRDWNHPTTFVKAALYKQHPFADLGIHDDYGFYLKMRKLDKKIVTVDKVLANFRLGGASNHKSLKEAVKRIRERYLYCYRMNGYSRWYLAECIAIEAVKMILG